MEVIMEVPDGWDKDISNQELVRCKDCKYVAYENEIYDQNKEHPWCRKTIGEARYVSNDFFCAYGERRTVDDGGKRIIRFTKPVTPSATDWEGIDIE